MIAITKLQTYIESIEQEIKDTEKTMAELGKITSDKLEFHSFLDGKITGLKKSLVLFTENIGEI